MNLGVETRSLLIMKGYFLCSGDPDAIVVHVMLCLYCVCEVCMCVC